MSNELTQYDVEELIEYCGGKCKLPMLPFSLLLHALILGELNMLSHFRSYTERNRRPVQALQSS